jgi:hypothetical protein
VNELVSNVCKKKMKNVDSFSITTDSWSDPYQQSWVAVTYHWISQDWSYFSLCRDVILIPNRHSSVNLATSILDRISYHFPNPDVLLGCVSTDCASNMILLSKLILNQGVISNEVDQILDFVNVQTSEPDEMDLMGESSGWRCVCHLANTALKKVLEEVPFHGQIESCRLLIGRIRCSPNLLLLLDYCHDALGHPKKKRKPILDVPTRFVYVYYMLERYISIFDAIQLLAATGKVDDLDPLPLQNETHLDFQQYVSVLQPIEKFVRLLEGEKYITISQVPFQVSELLSALLSNSHNGMLRANPKNMAAKLFEAFSKKFSWVNLCLNRSLVAACFDP